ncbi:MAG TPA: hypothetical protein VFD80_04140, partial [Flavobacteriaceae bacterium]|nr:hypothetical protein [Flavobacteriaceae bacterium]
IQVTILKTSSCDFLTKTCFPDYSQALSKNHTVLSICSLSFTRACHKQVCKTREEYAVNDGQQEDNRKLGALIFPDYF